MLNRNINLIALSFIVTMTAHAADVTTSFTENDVLTATKLNTLVTDINASDDVGVASIIGGSGVSATVDVAGDATVSIGTGAINATHIDSTAVQERLNAACAAGSAIRGVSVSGTPTCDTYSDYITDTDTLGELSCTTDQIARWNGTSWVCAANKTVTVLSSLGSDLSIVSPASTSVLLRNVGTFTKASANSTLIVTYHDILAASTAGLHCAIYVYIDNLSSNGSATGLAPPFIKTQSLDHNTMSSTGVFNGISIGDHTVSLYYRNLGTGTCSRNNGNWSSSITILEI